MDNIFNFVLNGQALIIFIIIVILFAHWYYSSPKHAPPGPKGLPFVGYLPFLGRIPHITFKHLGLKYGSVFSIYLGSQLVVVLNDYKAIYEAFVKKAEIFAGRPIGFNDSFPIKACESLTTGDGQYWKEHRKFAQILFKEYGVGNLEKETKILEEIHKLLDEIHRYKGRPLDIREKLLISVSNNIAIMVLGKSFDYNDKEFLRFHSLLHQMVKKKTALSPLLCFPWLKYVPGIRHLLKYDELQKMQEEVYQFLKVRIDDEKMNYINGQRNNYIAAFLTEQIRRNENERNDNIKPFSEDSLLTNMRALMIAGTETTTNTIVWAVVYMLHYPEVQKKIQDELDTVIGFERSPAWSDHLRTPYTEAVLWEIQRISDLIPLSLPHRNTLQCQLLGYNIPKDSIIIPNISNVHTDPSRWIDAERFWPERFLNTNGEVQNREDLIPFSIGKRQCLGEVIAKMELYLYFTSLLQKFTFKAKDGNPPKLRGYMASTHIPHHFEVLCISRTPDDLKLKS